MSATQAQDSRPTRKTLRQLLQDYPNSGLRVIGEGTVHVDAEKIRQSDKYKQIVARVRRIARSE